MAAARGIDDGLVRMLGLPYLRLTRERSIHERCRYGLAVMAALRLARPAVLDVGCGSGIMLRHLATYAGGIARYTGIDRAASRLVPRYRGLAVPAEFQDVDLDSDWRFPGHDLAWCSEVLEHLDDDTGVLGRVAASLKPGGHAIVTMPSLAFLERAARKMPYMLEVIATQDGGHVRAGYTADSLRALARSAGFETVRIDAVSPRTDAEIRNRYRGAPVLWHAIDKLKMAPGPAHVFDAGPDELARYFSIAALLRRP